VLILWQCPWEGPVLQASIELAVLFSSSFSLQPQNAVFFALFSLTNQAVSQLTVNALGGIAGTVNALGNILL